MGCSYHLMTTDPEKTYEGIIDHMGTVDDSLLVQLGLLCQEIRLDIGVKMNCRKCIELSVNVLLLASCCPSLDVHFFNMERFADKCVCYGTSCLPFVLVNGKYSFFGQRSPRQLLLMIAEVLSHEDG